MSQSQSRKDLIDRLLKERGITARSTGITRRGAGDPTPMSFAQERLWFLDQFEPEGAAYNLAGALALSGPLDVSALERALREVVRRHEALRTTFAADGDARLQVIHPEPRIDFAVLDWSARSGEGERDVAAQIATEARKPFDLAAGPLVRATLVKLGPEEHVLVHAMHHIVSDVWSMGVLVREVTALYDAFSRGAPSPLPELSVQYADYARFQRAHLAGGALEAGLAYFRQRLAGAPPTLDLPTDRPRPPQQSFDGDVARFHLPAETSAAIRELAKQEGVTLYAFLLAAFSVLLGRYSGQDDIVVGTPTANRTRPEVEPLIGFFVSTLVLRTDLSGAPTFRELLARAKESALGAFAHADVPFERIVEDLQPVRDPSRAPLFQVALALENLGIPELRLPSLTVRPLGAGTKTAKFDLMLTVVDGGGPLTMELEYATALFDASTMDRMGAHFATLLRGIVADPSRTVAALPMLTEAEETAVLALSRGPARDYPLAVPLHRHVEAQAARTPSRVALTFEGESLTFAELDARANQLAHHLVALGVTPGSLVGIAMERSLELVVALHATLRAGAAYVPIDPSYPKQRVAFFLEDAAPKVVLTHAQVAPSLPPHGAVTVVVDSEWSAIAERPTSPLDVVVGPKDAAYMIYTSGSTGLPKGAVNTHEGIVNRLFWMQEAFALGEDDVVLQKTPVSFDVSVWELFWASMFGARLVVAKPEGHKDPEYLAQLIEREGVTTLHFVPSMLRAFLEQEDLGRLGSLRRVICSGEALTPDLIARHYGRLGAPLHNLYGPTEAAVDVTWWAATPTVTTPNVPIGKPIANTTIRIVDGAGRPQPIGVPGELCIGGVQLARGYWKRPELTAERFVSDPLGSEGERLYKTGDRARWLPNGEIEYLGRIDFQVKLRGFRIELGEIEAALERHAAVKAATVLVREDVPGDQRLVAYLVAEPAPSAAELRVFLKDTLPEYMVPSAFVTLAALPLSGSGKVDRRALPKPEYEGEESSIVAPRTPTEEALLEVWKGVLRAETLSVTASFFDLGGHSLLATQVISRAAEALGVRVPLRRFFDAPTITAMAALVDDGKRQGEADSVPRLERASREGHLPLSFGQERLWFLFQLEPDSSFYNIPLDLRVRGALDLPALERAFATLVARHEVLRTTYASVSGKPTAVVHAHMPCPVPVLDLSHLEADAQQVEALRLAQEELAAPFDLGAGPVLRVKLVRFGAEDHALLLTLHHMVVDIWTTGIVFREVSALYEAYASGAEPSLAPLSVQYVDYAAWQRGYLAGETMEAELSHWREALAGAPTTLDLPTDRPRAPVQTFRGSHGALRFPKELTDTLRAFCRREGLTPYQVALGVFNLLLHRYTGQEDILVGTSRADRRFPETEGLVGYFLNQLVLRTKLDGAPSFRDLLHRVRETTLSAYAHQDMPFERIVELLRPERDLSRSPVFQVMVDNMTLPTITKMGSVALEPWGTAVETSRFDLTLALAEKDGGFVASLEYNADLFDASTIERMLGHFAMLLRAGIASPTRSIGELPMLTQSERDQVLLDWNATETAYATDLPIQRLIEAQVARTPDAPALRFEGQTLSYRELDSRANKVARYLQNLGAGPEVRIAVCVERSIEMVVGVLGVLKAGAAYVPMDPAWPADRLGFMLEDTAAPILLAQEKVLDLLPATYVQIVMLDADWAAIEAESDEPVDGGATGESLAYVIYTSGSTGKPKGVLVSHANLVHSTEARLAYYPDKVQSFLLLSSFAFDSSMAGIYWTLIQGGTITLPNEAQKDDPSALAPLVAEAKVSHLLCVPSLYTFLLSQAKDHELTSLVAVMVAGEAVPPDTVRRHHERLPAVRLYNEYGPTEATVWCTVHETTLDDGASRVPIGRPIANTAIYLLDKARQPVPAGVPGELYVGGLGITRGYLNRPELNAEKFVPNPFGFGPSSTLYRTGDLAKYRENGLIDFLGRIDHQVKIRGYRIELEEIEAVLSTHRNVLEVIVIVREDMPGDQRIVAYVVPADTTPPTNPELKAFLGASLPEYMIPAAFVVLAEMPLLPNGKVDRKALPAPESRAGAAGELVVARTPTEDVLAGIWASVLGSEKVGVQDNFFDLGGHSLLATQVVARINETFHVDLALALLFDLPTVASLAEKLDEIVREGRGMAQPPITVVPRDRELMLSFGQERLWVLDQIEPGNPFYNLPGAVRLDGPLDKDALTAAIQGIGERHELLRTTFGSLAGRPRLVFHETVDLAPEWDDLSHLAEDEQGVAVLARAKEETLRPFDLVKGPLARSLLLKLSEHSHVLVFTLHHIIADGWSMGVMVRELGELYAAKVADRAPDLDPLPVQYADYATWQRQWMRGEVMETQLAYWRQALAGAKTSLDLPTDRPRPAVITYRGARRVYPLGAELSRTLGELCRKEGVTLYMLALAGFGAVLGRYAGQDDVLIGTSVADRRRAETHGLIGYFLNQLVMRVRTNGEPTFAELLLRVREATLGAYAHGDLPFERLVEELRVKPDLSRAPLFQVMVDVANAPGEPLQLPGVTLSAVVPEQTTSRFDLTLSVSEGKDGIVASIEYSTELFDAATIDRLFGHFANLLARGAANPKAPLASLSLLDEEERNSLLFGWNQTAAEYPDDTPVHVLFEAQVDATPDAIAVLGGDARLTYRELDERANQLANHLVTLGVGPDVLVGLSVRRTPSLLVGLLGILKAGGAYVPIDPSYPIERIAFLLEDSMVPVVISEEAIADTLPTGGLVLRLDADWEEIATQPTDRPAAEVPTESLAYVIYTSGSTGKPKGALITHRGLVNYLWWAKTAYRADEGAGAPVHSSMSFDLTVTGLYLPLLTGKTVILVPEGDEITALADAVRTADGFSLVKLTPAHLELLNHAVPADAARGRVGTFVIGGEALSWSALAFWRQNAPGTRLINEYGPTETVVGCCVYDGALGPDGSGNVPIGRPIANTRLYVLDASMSPVPVGVPGELYIGGDGVARGYWNRDELTAQRFLADPFVPGGRLYKTGDLVRRLPDGVLDFLGRLDHQVKLRGYRIELGEIEAALRADPKVRDVAVLAREDSPGDRRLVAYVVLGEGEQAEAAELRAFVGAALPEYMVPSAVVFLDALPLTDNGKLDRAALPAPELRGTAGPERIAPRTAVEQGLAAIWTDVLGATELSIHDDFFELGGHSLLATQILARVRSTFGVDLPFRTIFESPTIAGLAAHIGERRGEIPAPVGAIPRADRSGALSLSFAQERLWFLAALEPESSAYNVAEAVRFQGPLDAAALAAALTGLVARHEVLRTSYPNREGVAEVRIYAPMPVELPLDDLGGRGASEQRAVVRGVIAEEAQRPFHLATGPLFRARLLRLSAAEHVLCLTMHHIVTDAWSQSVMLREVAALYEAAQRGAPAALPELPLQYVDYAAWQRARLTGEALERELGYWRERLAGMPQALDFPTDRPRPAKQSYAGDKVAFRVPKAVSEGLASLAQREGATLFMTLCAAFATLLQRYSGQDDLAIGTPVANRDQEALEPLVGMFLSTLVLRVDLAEEPSFRTLLGRVRETALGAYAHQGVPFERIVDAVAPERDMSRSPLFQALFTLQNAPQPLATWGGVSIDRLPPEEVAAKVDLALSFAETADGLVGAFEYATALFDAATIERLRDHLQALLRGIVETPELSIGDLPLQGPSELRTVLLDWNRTAREYPRKARLFDAFCNTASIHGARPALAFRDEVLTYGELDSRSNRLARYLAARGVGVGSLVGLFVERSPAMVVALLAILKAGGAYVPLDPAYPKARIELILKDAKAALLVSESALASQVDAGAASRVLLDADANAIAAESDAPFDGGATADSVAYAIYTSGSTGTPKGVLVHHRALVNFMASMAKEPGLGEADRLLAVTSLSFDIAGLELYLPLSVGALVDLADRETQSDGALLAQRLRTTGATVLQATPATFRLLLDAGWAGQPGLVILCGGEAFPRPLADALVPRAKAVWNMFGPTETTIWSTVQPVRAGGASSVPIGRPIANTQLYVVDRLLRPVPIGAPGELCIGGDGVAKGYYERDSLTAERFVAHPLADVVRSFDPTAPLSEKVYRTGDLVRWLADGTVEFLGRLDHQVKLRGYRIELGEIEALLGEHPAVREVVVVAREDGPAKALVAYAALAAGGALSLADMRAHLRDRLPEYMIPSGLVVLEALPRTPNGKLDRRALPKPTFARETTEIVLPRTRTEGLLADAWKSVLGLDTVSIHESFFELGGHSLLAMQLVARIRNAFDIELPVRVIFEAPTLAALAERIDAGHGAAVSSAPIPRVDRGGVLPLSFAQERFWFLAALEPESSAYNVPEAVRIRGPLDVSALDAAIAGLVARHEILRTVYPTSEGKAVVRIHEEVHVPLPVEDLGALDEAAQDAAVRRLLTDEATQLFDLAEGPLFRARLLRLTPESHVLSLTMHHMVTDAWSEAVMLREVAALYDAKLRGALAELPALSVQYVDYAAWQRALLTGEALEHELGYWRERLAGMPQALDLPTDRPRPPKQSYVGDKVSLRVPKSIAEGLTKLAQKEGATLFMALAAAFSALLQRYTGQDDIALGTPVANREREALEPLVGVFLNTLVLRVDLAEEPSFRALLARVRETALGAYAHQGVPFERVVDALATERDMSRSPLFQVLFTLQNAPQPLSAWGGVTLDRIAPEEVSAKVDLALAFVETEGGLVGTFEYATALFDASTIVRLRDHLLALLRGIVEHPDVSIGALPLLGPSELRTVLVDWNATATPYDRDARLFDAFRQHAARHGGREALVFRDEVFTYAELESRSNRLARHLAARGVGVGSLVGLYVPRSAEMVVALLGILKAGGAYVPLDPAYPKGRIELILADAGASVLVTESALAAEIDAGSAARVLLDGDAARIAAEDDAAFDGGATADSVAYAIYTSGSTGTPKGVLVHHRALVNFLAAMAEKPGFSADDRLLAVTSLSFDIAGLELYLPLSVGGTVDVADQETLTDGALLADRLRTTPASVLQATPATFRLLLDAGWAGQPDLTILCGGEAFPRPLADALVPRAKAVWNMFGPTETTIWSTVQRVEVGGAASVPIGKPIANTELYVVDRALRPVPIGVPGELLIGGEGVAKGYYKRDALSAERFIEHPLSAAVRTLEPAAPLSAKVYRTGDLVRWLADGTVEFLGRLDHQVKLRGYRIELGEIEAVLGEHPSVREVVVVLREDGASKQLVAYVALVPDAELAFAEARVHLRARLPEYMLPSQLVVLAALPRTPNGKIDRRALPKPVLERGNVAMVPPTTRTEELLAEAWKSVLGLDSVSIHESFFELGGHSLLAMQVVARVRRTLGVELPVRAMFEAPTIAGLAELIERDQGAATELAPNARLDRGGVLPLSFAQERFWFLAALEPESTAYNASEAVRIQGPLDVPALEAAVAGLVARHEVLRTVYPTWEGKAVVRIREEVHVPLPVEDLEHLDAAARDAAVKRAIADAARHVFDLAEGPLFKARLLRLSPTSHVLCLTRHHIVTDAWSEAVMLREVAALYESAQRGVPAELPVLALQYVDYAAWQRGLLTGEALEHELGYWRKRLAGMPQALDLPTDRPRPPKQSYVGDKVSLRVPKSIAEGLTKLAQHEGATLFMALAAAFSALLQRYTGQEDIALGTPVANRELEVWEPLVGVFLNTLVLRVDLSEEPSFRSLLARVRETAFGAYAHQGVPFERVVDALATERDMSRSPLFQVLFTLQNAPQPLSAWGGVTLDRIAPEEVSAKVDLALAFVETEGGLVGTFEYATALFDASTIVRLRDHLLALLRGIVEHPDTSIGALPLLGPSELRTVLVDWNATATPYDRDARLFDAFRQQAARHGGREALVFRDEVFTYAELESRSNRLARHLAARGVGVGSLVGLYVPRSAEMVVALLGILKAGGAYVPLDPAYPKGRIELILADAGASVLVTESALAAEIDAGSAARVLLDGDAARIAAEDDGPFDGGATADSVAYAIYTSGSTGTPKGVLVHHRALVNFLAAMAEKPGFSADDRLLAVTSLSFDIAGLELYLPLSVGGTVDVADQETLTDGALLADRLRTTPASVLQATPATFRLLLDAGWAGQPDLTILCGGEAFPRPLADALVPRAKAVWNMFGPTETTIWSTVQRVEVGGAASVPIGKPIANTELYVVDRALRPVPIGVPGELLIGGEGVAKGYYKRDALSAERFIEHPLSAAVRTLEPAAPLSAKVYRTGDLVRWLADGTVEFLGRLDHQVKLRGYRIELGEIEAVLGEHPSVREVVVVLREDGASKQLVAYVALVPDAELAFAEARVHLRARLPEYMLPSQLVVLAALPRTPNGKIDRRALPKPVIERGNVEVVLPTSRAEELLAEVWKSVLRVGTLSIHDNFFELGGDSILSIQVVSKARNAGLRITPRQMFQHQTIAELAAVAELAKAVVAEQGPVTGELSPTPIFGWWREHELPRPAHWNQAVLLEASGPLDGAALGRALVHVLTHHDALRLRWDGASFRLAEPGGEPPLWVIGAHELVGGGDLAARIRAKCEEAQESLDLAAGPILRAVLFEPRDAPSRLFLAVHHLAVDTVSWRLLLEDLWASYEAERAGRAPKLPPKTTSYLTWAKRLAEHTNAPETREERRYWLADERRTTRALPLDRPKGARPEADVLRSLVQLSEARTSELLRKAPGAYQTQVADLCLAALLRAVGRIGGGPSLLVAMEGHGREDLFEDVDITRTVGWFSTVTPLRLEVPADAPLPRLIKSVKEAVRAVPRGGIGYGLLRYLADEPTRAALQAQPQPELAWSYLGQLDQATGESLPLRPMAGDLGPPHDPRGARRYALEVSAAIDGGQLTVHFLWSPGLHERSTIERLTSGFLEELEALIAHCLAPEAGGYTPSDFRKVHVSQETLDMLASMELGDDDEEDEEDAT